MIISVIEQKNNCPTFYFLKVLLLTTAPSFLLSYLSVWVYIQLDLYTPDVQNNLSAGLDKSFYVFFLSAVIFAPIFETVLMAALLIIGKNILKLANSHNAILIAALSGLIHANASAIKLLPSVWAFYIMSLVFLITREQFSLKKAFVIVTCIHSVQNLLAFLIIYYLH